MALNHISHLLFPDSFSVLISTSQTHLPTRKLAVGPLTGLSRGNPNHLNATKMLRTGT